ncbi:MAG: alpha/beta fold hydrolase [Herminiimonas sp.]|nr:alpha/beta fold hydrolase [Herminiimonas sp.]
MANFCRSFLSLGFVLTTLSTSAAETVPYPAPKEGDWIARDFRFASGEVMPALRLHYTTIGAPTGEPVLILHGTNGAASSLLIPQFAGELFGPGQLLDASRYFIIMPDGLGSGKSAKPSDGPRMKFPKYNYDDMVDAQYRLMTEHFGLRHVRMILGYSMGGMHTWLWAQKHPAYMDIAVPMASVPVEMAGRNWMMRRMIIDAIRTDPEWMNGDYTKQPRTFQLASVYFNIATNGGSQALYKLAPTREKADQQIEQRMKAPFVADANDHLYGWEASRDFNPAPHLDKIQARLLAINSADDERNPPELGVMEKELKRVKDARYLLVPGSEISSGHTTNLQAKYWKKEVGELLQSAPRRAP